MARSLRFDCKESYDRDWYICDNSECENRRQRMIRELSIARYRIIELEKYSRSSNEVVQFKERKTSEHAHNLKTNPNRTQDFETVL